MSFNYLRSFCKLLEGTEVPPRFATWCGIASLLGAMEQRVWLNQGIYQIYPNFYMVLVAASGQKKSTAVNTASRLLRRLNPSPNVISQKITPQALIKSLQKTETGDETKLLKTSCGGIVIADELATFLDKHALEQGLGPILTALFDCTPFEYQTVGRGVERIEGGYLSILGGTTIELLRSCLPKDAIGGGFTSRTMFVYEEKVAPPVAWIDYSEELEELEQELVNYLQRLMELEGGIDLSPDAKEYYKKKYNERYYHSEFRKDPFLKQYENRRHAHLLKIAMALMVCETPQKRMEYQHIYGANVLLEEAEQYLPRIVELILTTDIGALNSLVYQYIFSEGQDEGIERSKVVRHFANKLDAAELSRIVDTLRHSGRVAIDTHGGKLIYRALKIGVTK